MVSEKSCEMFFGKITMQVHNPSEIWNQNSCKITGKNQSLVTLLTSLLIINFFTYRFSGHDWLWSEFQRPILMLLFFKYAMPKENTKLSGNKRESFLKKNEMFNVLLNILKFPLPENLFTPCKDTLDWKTFHLPAALLKS